jgi:SNF2 family DNA or RNA helicase
VCAHAASNDQKGRKHLAQFEYGGELLVISYDQLKIFVPQLEKIRDIGLVVCDEGHRLKNAAIQTSQAVERIPTKRRIVVTGTPIQVARRARV